MPNIYILFDCPDERNDKKWLIEELTKLHSGKVESVSIRHVLSRLGRKGIFGKLYAKLIACWQCVRALCRSRKGDVLICWESFTGMICAVLNKLLGNSRKLILMNWLTPSEQSRRWEKAYRMILQNPQCHITVNSTESPREWAQFLSVPETDRFHLMPDVFDTSVAWTEPSVKAERYCFTGGMNNRDWKLLCAVAKSCPGTRFVCVALEADFNSQVDEIPENVQVHFNLPAQQYYSLMNNAYAVLLPLRDGRVAGLINILRAAQAGVLCCISRTASTAQYYPPENGDLLIDGEKEAWIGAVQQLLALDAQAYGQKVKTNQAYICDHFSGAAAAKRILGIIEKG